MQNYGMFQCLQCHSSALFALHRKKKKEQRNVNRKQRNGGYTLDVSAGIGAPGTQEGTSL